MRKMSEKALSDAFSGESMAHMKYLGFADIAEKEGYPGIANLFRAIAYAEQVHALNHAKNLGLLKKTFENLQSGITGESFEVDEMYPAYDAIVKLQEEKGAQRSIHYAIEAEKIHAVLYKKALKAVSQGKDVDYQDVYVCPVCGYTCIGEPEEDCPVCKVKREKFKKFE